MGETILMICPLTDMAPTSEPLDAIFAAAAQNWNLEQLYQDLASVKCRSLTPTEKKYLRGVLCGYSPNEIAERLHVSGMTVRTLLSKQVYPHIEELLVQQAKERVRGLDWSRVPPLLERAGYKLSVSQAELQSTAPVGGQVLPTQADQRLGLEGMPEVVSFYGRQQELTTLTDWIARDQCRLVALLGMGGIGKTTLIAKLVQQMQEGFERVVWRSLHYTPPLAHLLTDWLQRLTYQPEALLSTTVEKQLNQLMDYLRQHRCLLILEDVQSILSDGELVGRYRQGYEGYAQLFRRIGEEAHQSCLLLTSWEKLAEVAMLEGANKPVRSLKLGGLGEDAMHLLAEQDLGDRECWQELITAYRGNPLALKLISSTIQELFDGSVAEFLHQGTFFLGDFSYLLHQQFQRLAPLEQQILHWLANQGQPVSRSQLHQGLQPQTSKSEILKVLESLGRRSLLEKVKVSEEGLFTLQPAIQKYVLTQGKF